jgi:NTP pyrophosphatase (non-canonical NTP hydrolase)
MAEYANQGNAEMNLVEELSEVIQVIAKKVRFNGDWHEVPPGHTKTRFQSLKNEMGDVLLAYSRLLKEINDDLKNECDLNSFENQSQE